MDIRWKLDKYSIVRFMWEVAPGMVTFVNRLISGPSCAFTSFGFDIRSGEDKGFGKLQLQYLDNNDCDSIIYFAPDTGTFNTSAEVYKLQRTNFNYNGDVNPGFLMTSCSVATWQVQNGLRRVKRENCMLQHSTTNRIRFVFLGYPFEYRMENTKWLTLRRPILFIL